MLVELYVGLPWSAIKEEPELLKQKSNIGDDKLFLRCPVEFRAIADHLRTLKYEDRPNYKLIYDQVWPLFVFNPLKTHYASAASEGNPARRHELLRPVGLGERGRLPGGEPNGTEHQRAHFQQEEAPYP